MNVIQHTCSSLSLYWAAIGLFHQLTMRMIYCVW